MNNNPRFMHHSFILKAITCYLYLEKQVPAKIGLKVLFNMFQFYMGDPQHAQAPALI